MLTNNILRCFFEYYFLPAGLESCSIFFFSIRSVFVVFLINHVNKLNIYYSSSGMRHIGSHRVEVLCCLMSGYLACFRLDDQVLMRSLIFILYVGTLRVIYHSAQIFSLLLKINTIWRSIFYTKVIFEGQHKLH